MNASGTQFAHTDLNRAIRDLKDVLDKMIEGGEI